MKRVSLAKLVKEERLQWREALEKELERRLINLKLIKKLIAGR